MRAIGSDLPSARGTNPAKRTLLMISDFERTDDIMLGQAIGQRDVRTLSLANNNIYLGCAIRHFSKSLANGKQDVGILRGFIDLTDWNFYQRSSLAPTLQAICEPKMMGRSLNSLLTRVETKKVCASDVEEELCRIVAGETITALALCLFVRSLVYIWLEDHKEAHVIGNELNCVKDFSVDARGTVLKATACALELNITVWFQIGNQRYPEYQQLCYNPEAEEQLELVVNRTKNLLVRPQTKQVLGSIQQTIDRRPSVAESEKRNTKNCNKCGRVKLQKFCVCRKLGQKQRELENSVQKPSMANSGVKMNYCRRCPNRLQGGDQQLCADCRTVPTEMRASAVTSVKHH